MEIGLRILGFIVLVLDYITTPIYRLLYSSHKRKLPPINDPLLLMSATKLADLIRRKKVSSLNVVETFIRRVQDVNPVLNAIVEECYSQAIEEAKRVDKLLENVGSEEEELLELQKNKPFLGVPITIKESCSLSGMSISVGSLTRKGIKAARDGEAVFLMRKAGAIPILISNTPELCLSWESNNYITGKTANPYDSNCTSGGSSGGESALIGSGASVFGVASDIAGSIRIPASFVGIFGHKPTPSITSIDLHYPNSTDENFGKFLTIGPLARYAEDLLPMYKVMAGKNAECLNLDVPVDFKELRVFYMCKAGKSFLLPRVDEEITMGIKTSVEHLRDKCGSKIEEEKFDDLEDSIEIAVSLFLGLKDIPNLLRDESDPKKQKNVYLEILKTLIGFGSFSLQTLGYYLIQATNLFIPREKYFVNVNRANKLKEKFTTVLGTTGVFLYPTFPSGAFYHDQVYTKIAGVIYTMIFNILGLPSTHVPLGLNSKGLPIGMQVVAGPKQDRLCLAVAKELENKFGGWIKPPE